MAKFEEQLFFKTWGSLYNVYCVLLSQIALNWICFTFYFYFFAFATDTILSFRRVSWEICHCKRQDCDDWCIRRGWWARHEFIVINRDSQEDATYLYGIIRRDCYLYTQSIGKCPTCHIIMRPRVVTCGKKVNDCEIKPLVYKNFIEKK